MDGHGRASGRVIVLTRSMSANLPNCFTYGQEFIAGLHNSATENNKLRNFASAAGDGGRHGRG
jgi:hypothetical protein